MAGYVIDWGILVPVIISIVGSVAAYLGNRSANKRKDKSAAIQDKKTELDITERVVKMADEKLEEMCTEVTYLKKELELYKIKISELERKLASAEKETVAFKDGVNRLCYQLKSMGQTPVWDPSLLDCDFISDGE